MRFSGRAGCAWHVRGCVRGCAWHVRGCDIDSKRVSSTPLNKRRQGHAIEDVYWQLALQVETAVLEGKSAIQEDRIMRGPHINTNGERLILEQKMK